MSDSRSEVVSYQGNYA